MEPFKNWTPFEIQTKVDHSKSGHVQFSDPHCNGIDLDTQKERDKVKFRFRMLINVIWWALVMSLNCISSS